MIIALTNSKGGVGKSTLAVHQALEIAAVPGLRLRQAFAEAAGQGTVVWRLGPRGAAATNEIKELCHGILKQIAPHAEPGVANG